MGRDGQNHKRDLEEERSLAGRLQRVVGSRVGREEGEPLPQNILLVPHTFANLKQ